MIESVIEIAREAGKKILELYDEKGDPEDRIVRTKEDHSPLIRADLVSNDWIVEQLKKNFPYPVQSEESIIDFEERKHWKSFWLVDPIDGSKEFLARTGEFVVSIAFIEDRKPVLGVLYAPALGQLYYAEKGKSAFVVMEGHTKRLPLQKNESLVKEECVLVQSRFHNSPKVMNFQKQNGIQKTAEIGSALKFASLSEGVAHIYPRYSGSSEWDIAAGHIILEEAGGGIIDLIDKKEIVYNKAQMMNPFFVAWSGGVDIEKWIFPLY